MTKHPMQPVEDDGKGVLRFKENPIVTFLLESGPVDMNMIARMPFSRDDRQHFAQLIGYSVYGYGDLSYADDDVYNAAVAVKE